MWFAALNFLVVLCFNETKTLFFQLNIRLFPSDDISVKCSPDSANADVIKRIVSNRDQSTQAV